MNNFLEQHENYKTYTHDYYLMNELSRDFFKELNGFIHGELMKCEEDEVVSTALYLQHKIAGLAKEHPVELMPLPYLEEEIVKCFKKLNDRGFHNVIEGLEIITQEISSTAELNDFLEMVNLGYVVESNMYGYDWIMREGVEQSVEKIEEVLKIIPNKYKDTVANLEEIKTTLNTRSSEKSIKNILRDCISATEGYVKSITGESDFNKSTKKFIENNNFDKMIVTDGLKIWKHIHQEYLDVRHGNNEDISELGFDEAIYYVERLMAYIKYLNKKFK